jgi:hypothetical protein
MSLFGSIARHGVVFVDLNVSGFIVGSWFTMVIGIGQV